MGRLPELLPCTPEESPWDSDNQEELRKLISTWPRTTSNNLGKTALLLPSSPEKKRQKEPVNETLRAMVADELKLQFGAVREIFKEEFLPIAERSDRIFGERDETD
ncbi:hypothetical protein QQF64_014657 [Cirrhinus molitorella]|uniref:Uncharacterized protein n=1 Tax=Cirrhinus molitorella TaxID=172907 RepID=A0ABR3NT65_9TELE